MPELTVSTAGWFLKEVRVRDLLFESGLAESKGAADRLIKQRAVDIRFSEDEAPEAITPEGKVYVPLNQEFFIRAGRRWKKGLIKAQVPSEAVVTEVKE